MKNVPIKVLCIGFLLLLIACKQKQAADNTTIGTSHLVSDFYKAPAFENDNRMEKITELEQEIQEIMVEHASSNNIPGIAYGIVVDNKLAIASATGHINRETQFLAETTSAFRIASMTKSFTAMAILKLRDEGKLSLSDPASKYIPEMNTLEYLTNDSPVIDIENLLTMTAGFPEDNPWGDRQLDETDQMLINLIEQGISFSNVPSHHYEYSNTGYAMLGKIITNITSLPYQEYIREHILKPLGMNNTYWEFNNIPEELLAIGYRWEDEQWKLEPMLHDGSFGAMGGLITSIEDFRKYVSFHLSAWPPKNGPDNGPIKRSSLREMHTPQFTRLNSGAVDFNGDPCAALSGYGYGLSISKDCKSILRVRHGGALPGFGSNYVFYPEYGIGIMAFGNLTYTGPLPAGKIEKLLFEIAELKPRQLPISNILAKRQEQVQQLIQTWDTAIEKEIVAENFYLDESRDHRKRKFQEIFEKAGGIKKIDKIEPWNQLRGIFKIHTENGIIQVYFSLTPEKEPKVQNLYVAYEPNEE
ncbi:MAG: beta-lactamase family protein [Maribacter sp.]|nr:beta-lactamase family protein [Maribacter sp.]